MKSLYSKSCKWSNFVVFPRDFHFLSWNKLKKVKHYAKKVSCLEKCPLNNFDKANFCKLRKGTDGFHQMIYKSLSKTFSRWIQIMFLKRPAIRKVKITRISTLNGEQCKGYFDVIPTLLTLQQWLSRR